MSFADRLKQARLDKGYTQFRLAELIDVRNTAISNYEQGLSFPNIEILYKLFDALEAEPNFLFQDEAPVSHYALSAQEKQMIDTFRRLSAQGRQYIEKTLEMAGQSFPADDGEEESAPVFKAAALGSGIVTGRAKKTYEELKKIADEI